MKVFVWNDVLTDYTSGIAIAVAETKEEAIAALLKAGFEPEWELRERRHAYGWANPEPFEPEVHDLIEGPIGVYCHGGG